MKSLVCALLLVLAACEQRVAVPSPTVRDSAGISIAEFPGLDEGRGGLVLTAEPVLELGVLNGSDELSFSRVVAAFGGPDRSTVIADADAGELRWFDAEGRHIRTVGRRGQGPGEFGAITWAGPLRGDTIGVWDSSEHRFSFFTGSGEYRSSYVPGPIEDTFESAPGTFLFPGPQVLGAYDDGSILAVRYAAYVSVETGVRRDSLPLMLFDRPTATWSRIGSTSVGEFFVMLDSERFRSLPLPFGIRTGMAIADDWLVIGWGDERGVTVMDRGGAVETVLRPGFERIPLERQEIEAYERERLAQAPEEDRADLERVLGAMPFPRFRPAHERVLAFSDEIWIQESDDGSGRPTDEWFVFTRGGLYLGSVAVPSDLRVTDAGPSYLIGVRTDELGVPRVERYGLDRSGAGEVPAS